MGEPAFVPGATPAPVVRTPGTVDAILVPLDGSEFAERALPVAARLAETLDAEIHLLSAVTHEDGVRAREADLGVVEVTGRRVQRRVVVHIDPAAAIHDRLESLTHAVVCMASHGRGRSAGLVGSVASEVVARSHEPLIVVGPRVDEIALWAPGGHASSGVVACIDPTPASRSLLPVALGWSRLLREPMRVVTVAEPVPSSFAEVPARRRFGPDGDLDAFLASTTAPLRATGAEITTLAILDPISPAEGMRSYLREHPASLVVVSSRTRHGLDRVVFGSVAASIIHTSPVPVLLVPRPDIG